VRLLPAGLDCLPTADFRGEVFEGSGRRSDTGEFSGDSRALMSMLVAIFKIPSRRSRALAFRFEALRLVRQSDEYRDSTDTLRLGVIEDRGGTQKQNSKSRVNVVKTSVKIKCRQ